MVCGKIRKEHPELAIKVFKVIKLTLEKGKPYVAPDGLISAFTGEKRVFPGDCFLQDVEITQYCYGNGDTVDVLLRTDNASRRNTELFLEYTHEKMKKRFGDHMGREISLMFDDEAYMGQWTDGFEMFFREKCGYDIGEFMPYIVGEVEPETIEQYRAKSDYLMLCGDLVRDNYFKVMREWLNEHHMLSVGHLDNENKTNGCVINRYGNMMKTLREFDIPGIDLIYNQLSYPTEGSCCNEGFGFFPLMASSAARQMGNSTCLSESFAVYGSQITPDLMRFLVNYQAVRGISLFNFMVISYDRKTVMSLQYRPNFIDDNPGMDCLGQINEYTARLSYILQNSKADIQTALYFPFRSICAGGEKGKMAMEEFEKIGYMLEEKGVSFDLIDEDFVKTSYVEGGRLVGEHVSYENVITPTMGLEPTEVIDKLAQTGKRFSPCIVCENSALMARKLLFKDGSEGYFICNMGGETICETVTLYSRKKPYLVNLFDGSLTMPEYTCQDNALMISLRLLCGEGVMVWLTDERQHVCKIPKTEKYAVITDVTSFVSRRYEIHPHKGPQNYYCNSGEKQSGLYEWDNDFSGEVTYTCILPKLTEGKYVLNLGEVRYFAKIYLNGKKIAEATMPPYKIMLDGAKSFDELKIVVANTIANACKSTDFFERQDKRDVGPYHEKMNSLESQVPAGGLIGPVVIEKVV